MKVKLKNVRLAFPALFEARTVNGEGEPRFSASFIFPHGHPCVDDINAAMEQVAKDKWGLKAAEMLKSLRTTLKTCLHNGEEKIAYEGYPGNLFLSASSKARPLVIDRDRSVLTVQEGKPYAGCYVNASIDIWAMDNKFGKRICASLSGVQFHRDGDIFTSGGMASAADFEDVSEGAEADALV